MKRAVKFFFVVFLAVASVGWATTPFEDGNALFREGKFAEAEVAYSRSLAQDGDAAATRFNLGKVREALADPAGAMLEWERALRLLPGYTPAREALNAARATLGSKLDTPRWWNRVQPEPLLGRERWVVAFGIWLAVIPGLIWALNRRRMGALICALAGCALTALGGGWWFNAQREAETALVTERAASLRAAPADPARLLDTLPAGSRVRVLDASGGWNRVCAPGAQMGWLPQKSIERISSEPAVR
jgi:tetratricopeptide (TPR) repeat protein